MPKTTLPLALLPIATLVLFAMASGELLFAQPAEPVRFRALAKPVPDKTAWSVEVEVDADEGWFVLAPSASGTAGAGAIEPQLELPADAAQNGEWAWGQPDSSPRRLTDGVSFHCEVEAKAVALLQKARLAISFTPQKNGMRTAPRRVEVPLELAAWGEKLPFENGPVLDLLTEPVDSREIYRIALSRSQQMISLTGLPGLDQLVLQLGKAPRSSGLVRPNVAALDPAVGPSGLYESILKSSLIVSDVYDCGKCDNLHVNSAGGVVISEDGLAVTNFHVLEQNNRGTLGIAAIGSDGICYPVLEVIAADEAADVALIRLGGDLRQLRPARLAERESLPLTPVVVLSHPHRQYFVLTTGDVSRRSRDPRRPEVTWLEITADFGAGSSGSGVFNRAGELVGLVSMVAPLVRTGEMRAKKPDQPDMERDDLLELLLHKCVPLTAIDQLFSPR